MESKVFLKTVLEKEKARKRLDTEFSTFVDIEEEPRLTISEFFEAYDELFFDIPTEGEVESHRALVNRSSELLELDTEPENIQPLLDEISTLRKQLLEARLELINVEIEAAGGEIEEIE